jgi:hypothetical protein
MELSHKPVTAVRLLREHLQFVSDSQGVQNVKDRIGPDAEVYDSFFVATSDGDYTEVWGMCGTVPYLSKLVSKLL